MASTNMMHADCQAHLEKGLDADDFGNTPDRAKRSPNTVTYVTVAAAPRLIWVTSLVLMLIYILACQGGFVFGRSSSERVLSVHYICMSIAWPILMTEALLAYRAPLFYPASSRTVKAVHATLQTLVAGFIVLAMVYAGEFKTATGGKHMWSVHTWVGTGAIVLYCLQYPLGLYVYLVSSWKPNKKADFYKYHSYLGLATYIAGLVGGISGLMETQEFDWPGASFVTNESYSLATLILAAKATLSLLLGLTVTLAFVVLDKVGTPQQAAPALVQVV